MPLTDTKIKALKPRGKAYQEADEGGLFIEVSPAGLRHGGCVIAWVGVEPSKRR